MSRILLLAGVLALAGCASRPPVLSSLVADGAGAVELRDTPFHPQQDYQCGPAALATALGASGVTVTPDALVPQVYLPGRRGSLQTEMVAAARRHGRLPVRLAPRLDALLAAVDDGRPVLVLQNLGTDWLPLWHYAVVIGYDAARDRVLLRSGTERRKTMVAEAFRRSWAHGDNWALVLLDPAEPPGRVSPDDYLAAVAGMEAVGRLDAAARGYAAARTAWPERSLAWLGSGNVAYRQGDLAGARDAYRRALTLAPGDAATANNLGQVLMELGCPAQAARVMADVGDAGGLPAQLRAAVTATRERLRAERGRPDAAGCEAADAALSR